MENKFSFIDSFRGVAIILVMLTHANYIFDPSIIRSFFGIVQFGARGVQLFYMISAFTLFNSYYSRKVNNENSIISFYSRRFFRIAPMFYISLIFVILNLNFHFFENYQLFTNRYNDLIRDYDLKNIKLWFLTTFTFTNGLYFRFIESPYPGGWSIAVEFIFYFIAPFLFYKIKTLTKALFLSIFSLFIAVVIDFLIIQFPFNIILSLTWVSIFYQFFFFSLGICLFFHINENEKLKITNINKLQISIIFILMFINILLKIINVDLNLLFASNTIFSGILFYTLVFITYKYKFAILDNKILQYIGKISFSIYLLHWWVIIAFSKISIIHNIKSYTGWVLIFFLFVLINVLFATITYKYIEKYFIKKGNQLIKKYLK